MYNETLKYNKAKPDQNLKETKVLKNCITINKFFNSLRL